MGSKSGQIKGYRYRFTIHMGISRGPIDAIKDIKVADRRVWPKDVIGSMSPSSHSPASNLMMIDPFTIDEVIGTEGGQPVYRVRLVDLILTQPPWVPGQHITISGFTRNVRPGMPGDDDEDMILGLSIDGTYEILERVGDPSQLANLQIAVVGEDKYIDFLRYGYHPIQESYNAAVTAPSIVAIDWTDDQWVAVDPPNTQELVDNSYVQIDQYDVFGGDESEGGILGWFTPLFGFADQLQNSDLVRMRGNDIPAYRDRTTAVFRGIIAANNPYPKPWSFRCVRRLRGWDGAVWQPGLATINLTRTLGPEEKTPWPLISAMNPAHILYECYTNRTWGRGLPRDALDETTWVAAATQLVAEGFGLCLRWTRTDEISSFVQSILDHIAAVVVPDRVTGKLKLELIRGGYDPALVPMFTFSTGLLEITEAAVPALPSYVNEIKVKYRDPITNHDGTVGVQNLAVLQSTGGQVNSMTREYPGIPIASLASRVAQRDLKALGGGLRRFQVKVDRRGWQLQPGGLMRIQDERRGIEPVVLRIGTVRDTGAIDIEAVEDVFSLPAEAFIDEQGSTWEPPRVLPCIAQYTSFEVPYALLVGRYGAVEADNLTEGGGVLAVAVAPGQGMNRSVEVATRSGAYEAEDVPPDDSYYCGYGD